MTGLTATQRELYWNVFRNLQKDIEPQSGFDISREQLTYIQADSRYLTYLNDYLDATPGIADADKTRIRAEAQDAHAKSNATLNDPTYSFSTAIAGMTNDFYFAIENEDRATLGALAQSPLQVAALPPQESLTDTMTDIDLMVPAIIPDPAAGLTVTPIVPEDFRYVPPVVEPRTQEIVLDEIQVTADTPRPAAADYTVKSGDSLWRIAKEQFGLTSHTDIARAVEHLAAANNLSSGTNANHMSIGQVLKIPGADTLAAPSQTPLNWAALDADTRGQTSRIAQTPAFQRDTTGTEQSYTIGRGGSLSKTIFEAARREGITIDRSQMNSIIERVAEGNGITNANIVGANQQVRISRDMLAAAPA